MAAILLLVVLVEVDLQSQMKYSQIIFIETVVATGLKREVVVAVVLLTLVLALEEEMVTPLRAIHMPVVEVVEQVNPFHV